jgi:hypothetical protein
MAGQVIAVGMGVRRVLFREHGFFDGLVLRVGQRVVEGMVPGIFQVTRPVLAWPCPGQGRGIALLFGRRLSR